MTDRWPFKWWKLTHHLMYIPEVQDKNCLMQLHRSRNTCIYITLTTKQCNFQLVVYCTSVSCNACICSSSCLVTALSGTALLVSAACVLACTTCKTFWKPTTIRYHSCCMCRSFPSAHSLYQWAVFFAPQYLFCSSVNFISASWYCFRKVCKSSAHPNIQFT